MGDDIFKDLNGEQEGDIPTGQEAADGMEAPGASETADPELAEKRQGSRASADAPAAVAADLSLEPEEAGKRMR